jgi:predicted Zn-dependent protease
MDTAYAAHAFHDCFENGRGTGELRLTPSGFRFRSGERSVTIPYDRAELRLGGASDRLMFIAHPAYPGWSIYTGDLNVLRDPVLRARPELAALLAGMRRRRVINGSLLVAALVLVLAVPLALLFNMDAVTRVAASQVPVSWEQQLGKTAFGQYQIQAHMIQDERAGELLRQLTAPLTGALVDSPYTFQFHIARDARINAFALPGGQIVLHDALILRADSAEELVGVLAHEIAHVTERHGTRNLITSAGIALTVQALIGDAGGLLATLATAAPFLLTQKYSRGFETDADQRGFALLTRASVDPRGMVRFFERMKQEEEKVREKIREQAGDSAADALAKLPEFLSTHPATDSRIEGMRRLAADSRGPYRDLNPAFRALKERIGVLATELATEPATKPGADKPAQKQQP